LGKKKNLTFGKGDPILGKFVFKRNVFLKNQDPRRGPCLKLSQRKKTRNCPNKHEKCRDIAETGPNGYEKGRLPVKNMEGITRVRQQGVIKEKEYGKGGNSKKYTKASYNF